MPGRKLAANLTADSRRCPNFQQKRGPVMKLLTHVVFVSSLLLVCGVLRAQGGCVNSPECPTAILGVVGAAGAALFARFRGR